MVLSEVVEMEEMRFRRRKFVVERKIVEIKEDDICVLFIGKVFKVDKMDYIFWFDDGMGVIFVESEENVFLENG